MKKVPPELWPLAVVLAYVTKALENLENANRVESFAIFAAGFSMVRKLFSDKTLRLHRNPPKAQ